MLSPPSTEANNVEGRGTVPAVTETETATPMRDVCGTVYGFLR